MIHSTIHAPLQVGGGISAGKIHRLISIKFSYGSDMNIGRSSATEINHYGLHHHRYMLVALQNTL